MFAGKTEELIRRVRRAAIARRSVQVFTHSIDRRNRAGTVSSHAGLEFPSSYAASATALEAAITPNTTLVAADEVQFFGPDILEVTDRLARAGLIVVLAGLTVTFTGEPFEPTPSLMATAEVVDRLTAICAVCGEEAVYHQRIIHPDNPPTLLTGEHIGGADKYEARCRRHFAP